MPVLNKRSSRVELVAAHLQARGHISEGSALVEYGRFRLADVIHRLRNDRADLVPTGKEIITIHKKDTQGNAYGEYHLVETTAAAARRMVENARARTNTAHGRLSERDHPGLHDRIGAR